MAEGDFIGTEQVGRAHRLPAPECQGMIDDMETIRRIDSDDMLMEQVEQALRMTPEERVWAGVELFESWCFLARGGILGNFPGADDLTIVEKMEDRLAIARMLDGRVPA
jgi:hypothetical protein